MHSVAETIKTLLPKGTRGTRTGTIPSWDLAPPHPADVFAVAASLLKRSGAYQYILSEPGVSPVGFSILVDDAMRDKIGQSASQWRLITDPTQVPSDVQRFWQDLVGCDEGLILTESDPSTVPPHKIGWWYMAMQLMFIADGAAAGLGFFDDAADPPAWYFPVTRQLLSLEEAQARRKVVPPSISQIPTGMNCVLPKKQDFIGWLHSKIAFAQLVSFASGRRRFGKVVRSSGVTRQARRSTAKSSFASVPLPCSGRCVRS
jgi:hypothetical protein